MPFQHPKIERMLSMIKHQESADTNERLAATFKQLLDLKPKNDKSKWIAK